MTLNSVRTGLYPMKWGRQDCIGSGSKLESEPGSTAGSKSNAGSECESMESRGRVGPDSAVGLRERESDQTAHVEDCRKKQFQSR